MEIALSTLATLSQHKPASKALLNKSFRMWPKLGTNSSKTNSLN